MKNSGQLAKPLSKEDLIQRLGSPGLDLTKTVGGALKDYTRDPDVFKQLMDEIAARALSLASFFGGKLSEVDAVELGEIIIDQYPTMSPEDITIFFKTAKAGSVKSPTQTYTYEKAFGRPAGAMIMIWLNQFQEARMDALETVRAREKGERHNEMIGFMNSDVGSRMMRAFADLAREGERTDREKAMADKESVISKIARKRGLALEAFYESANIFEHFMRAIHASDPVSNERLKTYWERTPLEEQANEWAPLYMRYSKDGKTHMYLFGDTSHTRPMWNYIERTIKEEHPDAMALIRSLALESWKARLIEDGQEVKGETSGEIDRNLDRRKPISDPILHYRAALAGWWANNMI